MDTEGRTYQFSFGWFVADNAIPLAIGAFCIACVLWVGSVVGISRDALIFIGVFMAVCIIASVVLMFLRKRSFYRALEDALAAMDASYQLSELLDGPSFLEGRIVYEALDAQSAAFGNEAAAFRLSAKDYHDYIELWIHEIKTPLAAAKLILSRMHGKDADKLSRELERIENQVEQALYYARSTSIAADYSLSEISLSEAVNAACKKDLNALIENGVAVRNQVGKDVSVIADKPWVVFMIGQIVANSAKYGATEISFTSREEKSGTPRECTLLEIRDDGMGIPASDVPRVFDRAFTGRNARTIGGSTGYGLYLVALMADRLGLGVSLASEEGSGTRVFISFPHDRRLLMCG